MNSLLPRVLYRTKKRGLTCFFFEEKLKTVSKEDVKICFCRKCTTNQTWKPPLVKTKKNFTQKKKIKSLHFIVDLIGGAVDTLKLSHTAPSLHYISPSFKLKIFSIKIFHKFNLPHNQLSFPPPKKFFFTTIKILINPQKKKKIWKFSMLFFEKKK